ncbi:TonB-dependent receptor domain-containing protein [Mucilaginibacter rubeus]|uniref:TonB-dependent receptor n=1 Tax=Mucilaginibacter rubeus TaxID=2027860 RepID=A0A5C1I6G7_9SPHI|nr:TonB-dependent receptor [Mucilaginibacter rubeus]QEM13088.1 TonB-dependent receptor [Mucilaginibacter rubeus]
MKHIYSVLFFSLIYSGLFAQVKVSGKVTGVSQNPLVFAVVNLQQQDSEQTRAVQTDSAGIFSFTAVDKGNYNLTVTYTGYQTTVLKLSLQQDTTLSVTLVDNTTQLNEVKVTASKASVENKSDKLVYNVSTSATSAGADALTVIGRVPGVKVGDNDLSIVGKGSVKVMVNERLVQLAGADLLRYLRSLSASQVGTIELIKNPGAAYDAEGNAGLINITLKHSKKQGYSGSVQVNQKQWLHNPASVYGTSNYWWLNASGDINYNTAKLSAYASVNVDHDHELEGFETDIYYPKQTWLQTDTGNYRYHNLNFIAGADYRFSPKVTAGINYQGGKNTYDGSDHVNNPIINNGSGAIDSTLKTYATYHPVAISNAVNLHSTISLDTSGAKLLLNADYFNYYRTDRSDFESNTYLADGTLNAASRNRYHDTNKQDINIYTFKADAFLPTKYARFAFGGKLSFINNYSNAFYYKKAANDSLSYDRNLSNEFTYTENTQSVYGSINREDGKWKYQAGLRVERTETKGFSHTLNQTTINNYTRLFPSATVSYQAGVDHSLALNFGRRVNRPTFWNLNPFKSLFTAYSYGEGNPYLQPEYNTNFELSHTYKNRLTSAIFLNVTNNGFNNVTIARADTNLVYTTPLNFIKTYRLGISENYSMQLLSWLDNNNQFTFYHTDAKSALAAVKGISGFGVYIATNNNIYFNADKSFSGAVNFWYQFPEIDHIGRSDAYYKLDLGIKAFVFKKKVDVSFVMNDVFRSSASAVTTVVNGVRQKYTNFQINRYALVGISYRFGNSLTKAEKQDTGNQDEKGRIH